MENNVEHTYTREYIEKLLIQNAIKFDENKIFALGAGLKNKKLSAVFYYDAGGNFTHVEIVSAPVVKHFPKWVDKNGKSWNIQDMETSHLENTVAFLTARFLNHDDPALSHWATGLVIAMERELDSRE